MYLSIKELLVYTDEERSKWQEWFSKNGDEPLKIKISVETESSVGSLILHCFQVELWYLFFMRNEILTPESEISKKYSSLPTDQVEAIFNFGNQTRKELYGFIEELKESDWSRVYSHEFKQHAFLLQGSLRKLLSHTLIHEIRHWAQIAMTVRQHQLSPPGQHDFIFTKALD
ncbi:MAG: DinB family protein [Blastocatellia bacterium]|nr:DinB family protein [Blastocatellia bacterium]